MRKNGHEKRWPKINPQVAYAAAALRQGIAFQVGGELVGRRGWLRIRFLRSLGTSLLEDQAWGGVAMWALGGAIDMAAVLVVVARVVGGPRAASVS